MLHTHTHWFLGNFEGAGRALNELPSSLEPSLVSSLCLADIKLSVWYSGFYKLVLPALISVSCPCQYWDKVVFLAVNVCCFRLQYVCGGNSILVKSTLIIKKNKLSVESHCFALALEFCPNRTSDKPYLFLPQPVSCQQKSASLANNQTAYRWNQTHVIWSPKTEIDHYNKHIDLVSIEQSPVAITWEMNSSGVP